VSMYSKCKCMDSAYRVFCNLFQPDLVTWSALITGYSQSGDYEKALCFFKKLNTESKKADPILIVSVVAAATQLANALCSTLCLLPRWPSPRWPGNFQKNER
jgi:pentatricopeptide repeat protein